MVFHLFFYTRMKSDMQKWINLAFRVELVVGQGVSKFKLIKVLIGVGEHDFREQLLLFGKPI